MAKSQSIQTPCSNHYPIKYYRISYEAESVEGFKNDKGITVRSSDNRFYAEDIVDEVIKDRNENGFKKIKKEPLRIDLPRKCPKCGNVGSPSINKVKQTYALKQNTMSDEEKTKLETNRLFYHHSKSPETCFVGFVNISKNGIEIKLNSKLPHERFSTPIDALGYHRRVGVYPLK